MKYRSFESAIVIVTILALGAGVNYAAIDEQRQSVQTLEIRDGRITMTDQRIALDTPIPTPAQLLLADSSDTIVGGQVDWEDISAGGVDCSSATYAMIGSAGEPSAGDCSSDNYGNSQGSVQVVNLSCCTVAGDANEDGSINVGDAVHIVNYVFKGGTAPSCLDQADPNCDGLVNVGDAVHIINYVFKGGPDPCCP